MHTHAHTYIHACEVDYKLTRKDKFLLSNRMSLRLLNLFLDGEDLYKRKGKKTRDQTEKFNLTESVLSTSSLNCFC